MAKRTSVPDSSFPVNYDPMVGAELAQHLTWMACDRQPQDGLVHFAVDIHRSLHSESG